MTEGVTQSSGSQAHFARRATGFVRDIKVRDAVIFNVLPACPGLVMAVSVFWVLSTFTGVNLYVAILITIACAFLISGAFGLLSQIMPRSGGDYILISRSLHPALAIGSSILIGTSAMLAMGYWGVFTAKICIGPMMTMLGVSVNSHWLQQAGVTVTNHPWNMIIGFVEVAILATIMAFGTRFLMRVQFWLFVAAMLGFIVAAITLLVTSHQGFINDYNHYAQPFTHHANTYAYFMHQAAVAGTNTHAPTNWHNTIVASGAFIAFGVWAWYSVNYAGEIRQAGTRKNWYSMLGGLALTFVPILLMVLLLEKTVSLPFLTAVNAVSSNAKVYTLPNQPWWITLVAAIQTNGIFVAFLGLTFIAWAPLIVYTQIVQPVRALFAWAFDQVIPERIATVNERTHTPVFSLGLITVLSILFLYAAAYSSSFLNYVALSTIVGFPTFILVGISAIVFPYRRRAAYQASASNISFLGLPLLVYFGVGSIAAGAFGGWLWLRYSKLGLPHAGQSVWKQLFTSPTHGGLALVATGLIVGGIIYYGGRAWRRTQGIDISLNYLEIPPE
ncbi:MAG TPA: APC family permease [Solirubrobacteraceae bacterium]|jgi:amino acid transporter|nr:APC family permease [Solirubrobacteraceae bacterium]